MKKIEDEKNLDQKKILLRLDLNIPLLNGVITDSTRIDKILPTLSHLLKYNCKIIIISHIGRPKGKINLKGRTITIYENKFKSSNISHDVIFDRIEFGTYMIASALLAKKNIIIDKIDPKIVRNEINILKNIGVKVIQKKSSIIIKKYKKLKK